MTQEVLAYMAGLVDGDGCLSFQILKRSKRPSNCYAIKLTVVNTSLDIMEWLEINFGSYYYQVKRHSNKHKQSYCWEVNSLSAARIIEIISPYLVIKKKQAIVLMKFRELQMSMPRTSKNKYSKNIRNDVFQFMKSLNLKGPKSVETNTADINDILMKIESELRSNVERMACESRSAKQS